MAVNVGWSRPSDRPPPRARNNSCYAAAGGATLVAARATLGGVTDPLIELSARLEAIAEQLRAGELEPDAALALIEECASLAAEASVQVEERGRAALEPLPDLPGQLPLPAA
jgi:hypothetical protein